MKNSVVIGVILGFLVTGSQALSAGMAPDWTLLSADGRTTRLSEEVRQQPVVLFFWATWCPYCKALMPHLQSIRLEYGDQVKILAINFIETGDPVEFIRDAGYDFTVLPEGDDVAAAYEIYGTPGVIVVDHAQQIRFDLRDLPPHDVSDNGKKPSHKRKAAFLAPYWAAAIRTSIDSVLETANQ